MGQITLLPSAVRTATQTGDVVRTGNERGAHFLLNMTVVPGVDTLTLTVEGLDSLGNVYPLIATTAQATTGMKVLRVYPDLTAAANAVLNDFLPDRFRWTVTHSAASNFTYSLAMNTSQ